MSDTPHQPLRLGMFGGAFDPPHQAHVALAQAATAQLGLHRLFVVPTGQPAHRKAARAGAAHRLAMARLAFGHLPKACVEALEVSQPKPSYTMDTLMHLRQREPDAHWFVVLGHDQFDRLADWHRIQDLCRIATFAVAARPMDTKTEDQNAIKSAASTGLAGLQSAQLQWAELSVSATHIRQALATPEAQRSGAQRAALHQLPLPVLRYIELHGLYQQPTDPN